ncbi:MAG: cobalamin-binding protein, partial [Chloroflexi bacterium]|nr:cobalamin-binding protein [Chloroflexota bacterium]
IAAVRTGRILAIDPDIVSRPGPRLADAVEEYARLLHPAVFR